MCIRDSAGMAGETPPDRSKLRHEAECGSGKSSAGVGLYRRTPAAADTATHRCERAEHIGSGGRAGQEDAGHGALIEATHRFSKAAHLMGAAFSFARRKEAGAKETRI